MKSKDEKDEGASDFKAGSGAAGSVAGGWGGAIVGAETVRSGHAPLSGRRYDPLMPQPCKLATLRS